MDGGGGETQTNDPWSGQQPYLQDLFSQASGLFDSGIGQNYYPGQTVADFSPQSMYGMDMLTQRGMQGSPQQDAMGGYLNRGMGAYDPRNLQATAGGAYLGSNPYLDSMFNNAASRVNENFNENIMPGMAAQFGSAGRTGSDAQALMMGRAAGENQDAISQLASNIYAPAYESERGRQMEASGMLGDQAFRAGTLAPQFRDMQYGDINQLMNVGGMVEDQSQRYIDAERDRFNFYQQAPWQTLGQYGNIVQGMPSGYGTQTQSGSQGSQLAGAAGGAMAGYQMAGPYGAAAGGLLGFL